MEILFILQGQVQRLPGFKASSCKINYYFLICVSLVPF